MDQPPFWADRDQLANLLASWRELWIGRDVYRVSAGTDWLRIHLEGEDRPGILLSRYPGANLVTHHSGVLSDTLYHALEVTRDHPLSIRLKNARLVRCGALAGERVVALGLVDGHGEDLVLMHQLFGARGNTVLLDRNSKLLWSRHRPPHSLLTDLPPEGTWTNGNTLATPAGETAAARALDALAATLARRMFDSLASGLRRQLQTAARLVDNLERDLLQAEQGDRFRRTAEALAANLHTLGAGAAEVTVSDPRDGEPLTIDLDPALSPAANMESWFRRARKAEKGHEIIARRHAEAEGQRDLLAATLESLPAAADVSDGSVPPLARLAALQLWAGDHAEVLDAGKYRARGRRGAHGPDEPARPFRRYLAGDRWEIWVGRNNKENDNLTHRASHVRDLWFHAQGVSGSHVILRTGGKPESVPRRAVEQAAALAAMHSKARHSALVPVIWTERRYVRKPRKAPPGTAVCLREKSLFVEPGVAAGVVAI